MVGDIHRSGNAFWVGGMTSLRPPNVTGLLPLGLDPTPAKFVALQKTVLATISIQSALAVPLRDAGNFTQSDTLKEELAVAVP